MEEKNRMVNTRIWNDNYIQELEPLEDRLFVYFLTNEHTHIAGVYELPIYTIASETKMDRDWVKNTIEKFERDEKVFYANGWIFIRNFLKYQKISTDTQRIAVTRQWEKVPKELLAKIKEKIGKNYRLCIGNTYSIHRQANKRKEKEKKRNGKEKEKKRSGFSLLNFYKNLFQNKFETEPALSDDKGLEIIESKIDLFKNEDEAKELITAYFGSDKGEEYGYTLSACFTDHTINLWKTGGLTNNSTGVINCDE